jgi:multifunctional 2-oxoglutarate metabolism enzyme
MTLTSTYDHRIIQGAESGAFLNLMAELLTGNHKFYYELFRDLGIPQPPLSQSLDLTPFGRSRYGEEDVAKKQAQVLLMIRAYRVNGHFAADINPLGYTGTAMPQLDPAEYGLTIWDLDREFYTNNLAGFEKLTLREILDILYETYTRKVGVEYMHITEQTEIRWLQERIEPHKMQEALTKDVQIRALEKLNAAEALENFIHKKYIGHKRFSLEGAESMIAILDRIISDAADQEVKEIVVGMAHRGRLNVLANIMGKPYEKLFREFEGIIDPTATQGSGDVKYHLGSDSMVTAPSGAQIRVHLSANPSHLEAVNPVVEGMARAIQDGLWQELEDKGVNFDKVIPILIHGDAAFAGQGVVAETMNLSQLKGYSTGGTIHLVVNNQIGFTTNPEDARSSHYATDVARMFNCPIFHVNGDDPEACVRVARLALDYRQVFNKDVVIDMMCYRLHGHNEGDDPSYTQWFMYEKIKAQRSTRKVYTELLLRRGDLNIEGAEKILNDFQTRLNEAFDQTKDLSAAAKEVPPAKINQAHYDTNVSADDLALAVTQLTHVPADFPAHPKLRRQLEDRFKQFSEHNKIDWSLGEALAFGTLLMEGNRVRLSGEDVGRGTFSHRHSVLHSTQVQGEKYVPLNHIKDGQAKYEVYDSLLSEYAVLGFEYGYSVFDPKTLVIWEAQFGDFANGAQIIYDQFIAAAEAKWGQTCSLVSLLPHGYEGQGPEHSSARLERYLQLCAEDNMFVCNFTTPANLFHALRRQMRLDVPKPMIVMSPKSLLRHKSVVSSPQEFTAGGFQKLIPSHLGSAKKLVFCSGKVYYDAVDALEKAGKSAEVALARVEQYYPFPAEEVAVEIAKFGVKEITWLQEEPENMGAWRFIEPCFEAQGIKVHYVGRSAAASTATGISKVHAQQQETILNAMMG